MQSLGRLEPVDLRRVWRREAEDFTSWLAKSEHLLLLGQALDLSLELEAQEQEVGPFRADLLCKDTGSGAWVLIENQLERTDHTHLGQLLTYAAGLQAATIIWISARFTEEHRAALDWLNEITSESFTFFGVEIELWRIGESPVAPRFNIISKPNDWSKSVQQGAKSVSLTPNRELQLAFWTDFRTFLQRHSTVRATKPQPQGWMPHPIGRTGFTLISVASLYDSESDNYERGELRVELVVNHRDAKALFAALEQERAPIERALAVPVTWHNPDSSRQAKIYVRRSARIHDREQWPEYFAWLRTHLELFAREFSERVRSLKPVGER